jgi:benzoyl-CoA-dihydrodiol lyase
LKFLAAVNGACAGGGYELAAACDEILLVDDRSSAVSLPEVPLLGVLPGTGGLTRLTDKRKVRHDHADIFCTTSEGIRGQRAKDWRLVDEIAKPAQFAQAVQDRARYLAAQSDRPSDAKGVTLTPLQRDFSAAGVRYQYVDVKFDRQARTATITVHAPSTAQANDIAGIEAAGAHWWPLQMARELDDAILHLRTNEIELGTWLLKTAGEREHVLACDASMQANATHWLVRETLGLMRRTFARIDVSSRSLFALIDEGSCFAGSLAELAFAADRSYMLMLPDMPQHAPLLTLSDMNFGSLPMITGQSRLARRFYDDDTTLSTLKLKVGQPLNAEVAMDLGLVTSNPDDIDWEDEIRLVLEERASMSPDALTGMEANLRFNGQENMFTRIFGRLSAWQNWIFNRPNAVGESGALKIYGTGSKAKFDFDRI